MLAAEKLRIIAENTPKIYEAGQAQKEREFWDIITANNTKIDYYRAFVFWNWEYIKPPYQLKPTTNHSFSQTFATNRLLKKIEAQYFDFSNKERATTNTYGLYYTFQNCVELEEIEDIGIQPDYSLASTFVGCKKLKKIACIRVDADTKYSNSFSNCGMLEDVTFEGEIGQNGLNFQSSPNLTIKSMRNIISCLKDFNGTETRTITFGAANLAKLTDAEKAIATQRGWSLV